MSNLGWVVLWNKYINTLFFKKLGCGFLTCTVIGYRSRNGMRLGKRWPVRYWWLLLLLLIPTWGWTRDRPAIARDRGTRGRPVGRYTRCRLLVGIVDGRSGVGRPGGRCVGGASVIGGGGASVTWTGRYRAVAGAGSLRGGVSASPAWGRRSVSRWDRLPVPCPSQSGRSPAVSVAVAMYCPIVANCLRKKIPNCLVEMKGFPGLKKVQYFYPKERK